MMVERIENESEKSAPEKVLERSVSENSEQAAPRLSQEYADSLQSLSLSKITSAAEHSATAPELQSKKTQEKSGDKQQSDLLQEEARNSLGSLTNEKKLYNSKRPESNEIVFSQLNELRPAAKDLVLDSKDGQKQSQKLSELLQGLNKKSPESFINHLPDYSANPFINNENISYSEMPNKAFAQPQVDQIPQVGSPAHILIIDGVPSIKQFPTGTASPLDKVVSLPGGEKTPQAPPSIAAAGVDRPVPPGVAGGTTDGTNHGPASSTDKRTPNGLPGKITDQTNPGPASSTDKQTPTGLAGRNTDESITNSGTSGRVDATAGSSNIQEAPSRNLPNTPKIDSTTQLAGLASGSASGNFEAGTRTQNSASDLRALSQNQGHELINSAAGAGEAQRRINSDLPQIDSHVAGPLNLGTASTFNAAAKFQIESEHQVGNVAKKENIDLTSIASKTQVATLPDYISQAKELSPNAKYTDWKASDSAKAASELRTSPEHSSVVVSKNIPQDWSGSINSQQQQKNEREASNAKAAKTEQELPSKGTADNSLNRASVESSQQRRETAQSRQDLLAYSSSSLTSEKSLNLKNGSIAITPVESLLKANIADKHVDLPSPQALKLGNSDKQLFISPQSKNTESLSLKAPAKEGTAQLNAPEASRKSATSDVPATAKLDAKIQSMLTEQTKSGVEAKNLASSMANLSNVAKGLEAAQNLATAKKASSEANLISGKELARIQSASSSDLNLASRASQKLSEKFDMGQKNADKEVSRIKAGASAGAAIEIETSNHKIRIGRELNGRGSAKTTAGNNASTDFVPGAEFAIGLTSKKTEAENVLQLTLKHRAGEEKHNFPGAELTIAAVLALSGACKQRDNNGNENNQTLRRKTYMVEPTDTIQSIAEKLYGVRDVAGLIADINTLSINDQIIDGRRIIELRARQALELPVLEEITIYLKSLPKDYDVESIVSIVNQTSVNVELLKDFLGKVCDEQAAQPVQKAQAAQAARGELNKLSPKAAQTAQTTQSTNGDRAQMYPAAQISKASPAALKAAKDELPQLILEDKTPPPSSGLGAVVTDIAALISRAMKRPTRDIKALS